MERMDFGHNIRIWRPLMQPKALSPRLCNQEGVNVLQAKEEGAQDTAAWAGFETVSHNAFHRAVQKHVVKSMNGNDYEEWFCRWRTLQLSKTDERHTHQ
jgi:hypothetical protein